MKTPKWFLNWWYGGAYSESLERSIAHFTTLNQVDDMDELLKKQVNERG